MEKKISELEIGERFKYKGKEFTKLDAHLYILDLASDGCYGNCQWCSYGCDCDYENSFVRKYLNTNYLNLGKYERNDFNTFENGDYCRLITEEEFDNYKKYIITDSCCSSFMTSTCGDNGIVIIGHSLKDGYYKLHFSKNSSIYLRPLFDFKDEIVVNSLGNPKRDYFKCSKCGCEIKLMDNMGLPTANIINGQAVCDLCAVDVLMPEISDDRIKLQLVKKGFDNLENYTKKNGIYSVQFISANNWIANAYKDYMKENKENK